MDQSISELYERYMDITNERLTAMFNMIEMQRKNTDIVLANIDRILTTMDKAQQAMAMLYEQNAALKRRVDEIDTALGYMGE